MRFLDVSEMRVFFAGTCFNDFFAKINERRRNPRAQHIENPYVKVTIPFAIVFYAFGFLEKRVKTKKIRSRLGVTILATTVIFV